MRGCRDIDDFKDRVLKSLIADSFVLTKYQGVHDIFKEEIA